MLIPIRFFRRLNYLAIDEIWIKQKNQMWKYSLDSNDVRIKFFFQ